MPKNQEMVGSWMCAQHYLLEGTLQDGQLLVLLDCTKVELNGRCYDNWNMLSFLVPGGKEKSSIVKIVIF